MKGIRINRIKNKNDLAIDNDCEYLSIHNYGGNVRNADKIIIQAVIFSFVSVLLFTFSLFIPLIFNKGIDGIVTAAFISTPIFFVAIIIYIVQNCARYKQTITTYVVDRYNKKLYSVIVNTRRDYRILVTGETMSIPDIDEALRNSKNHERIISDVKLTKKNINIVDFWFGGDIVEEYSDLFMEKENDKYFKVRAKLTNRRGTTFNHPRTIKLKISQQYNDTKTIKQIINM